MVTGAVHHADGLITAASDEADAPGRRLVIPALVNAEEGRAMVDAEWISWTQENGYEL